EEAGRRADELARCAQGPGSRRLGWKALDARGRLRRRPVQSDAGPRGLGSSAHRAPLARLTAEAPRHSSEDFEDGDAARPASRERSFEASRSIARIEWSRKIHRETPRRSAARLAHAPQAD